MTWCDFWKNLIIGLIPALIVAGAAIVTLKHFYSKKWWEKKSKNYSAISRDLAKLSFCVEEVRAELESGKKILDNHRSETLGNEYRRRLDSLKITKAGGAFIISKEVSKELGSLIKDLENNYYNRQTEFIGDNFSKILSEYYRKNYQLIETCVNNFNKLAKKDLKTN